MIHNNQEVMKSLTEPELKDQEKILKEFKK